jgi:heme exporter protein C
MNSKNNLVSGILFWMGLALMVAALYMVFVYVPTEKSMGIVQRIFYFHLSVAWVSFLAFAITFVASILYLRTRAMGWDNIAHASAEVGVIFTTLVLITGPIWAKAVWGIWWTWDARLTTSLVLWLIYVAYLLVRSFAIEPERGARFGAVIGVVGFIDVPIVFLAVNLWRTQHPTTIVFEGGLTASMFSTLLVCLAAFTVLYVLLTIQSANLKSMEAEAKLLQSRQVE